MGTRASMGLRVPQVLDPLGCIELCNCDGVRWFDDQPGTVISRVNDSRWFLISGGGW